MSKKEKIFIHIPKTGGTTLNCAINGSDWQTEPDFYYRHIIYKTKLSNSGDIFEKKNLEKYQNYDIFSIIRHPVDRLISEYFFIRDRNEFMNLLAKKPRNLEEYARSKQTQNYMTSFFLGGRMFAKRPVGEDGLQKVLSGIDNLPIYVGIFEEYEKSMTYLSNMMNIKWPKNIEVKRVTLNRPELSEITEETKQLIEESNVLDMQLYNHCKSILDAQGVGETKVTFDKDKYGYIMKFTQRFNLLELYLNDKNFIHRNNAFFGNLNMALHNKIPMHHGKKYVMSWNKYVFEAIHNFLPDFGSEKLATLSNSDDPLLFTKQFSEELDHVLKRDKNFAKKLLKFDVDKLEIANIKEEKKSFLGRLFGR